jgi:predicted amino acid dehydrogenase
MSSGDVTATEPDGGGQESSNSAVSRSFPSMPATATMVINEPSLHYRRLRVAMIEAERQVAVGLSEEGVIGATVLRLIERDLDLEAMLLRDSTGSDRERADSSRAAVRETTRLG